ncbi:MAG: cupin domain-containing protein [Anaerolineae bacterium]|nr:cupin domain-containing protein [Anaerolineae bacterium]
MPTTIAHYQNFTGAKTDKFYKATLFSGQHLMIGLNCLEPGQVQSVHQHSDQDKFYFVLEGVGLFTVGEEVTEAGPGHVVWAAAGMPHGVENRGTDRLTLLMGIAPTPS